MRIVDEKPLTAEEELALIVRAQAGDLTARDRLVTGNWGLMLGMARRYRGRVELLDALQEMSIVLVRSVIPKYKRGHGRLMTYAKTAFKRQLRKVSNATTHPVKLPNSVMEDVFRKDKSKPGRASQELQDAALRVLNAEWGHYEDWESHIFGQARRDAG